MKKINFLMVILLLLTVFTGSAQTWNEIAKAVPTIHEQKKQNQYYGKSVAIDGDYAVVGASGYENRKGIAYVLFNNAGTWETMARLTASDGAKYDNFGISVSISGDNIVIGAYGDDDNGSSSGSAYVFTKPSGEWEDMTQTAKLTASDGADNDDFGISVGISGDNIVIGASGDDDNEDNSGSAYVFTKPSGGWTNTTQTAKLTVSDGASGDIFGCSVSISGDNIVIGAYDDDDNGSSSGSVYVFTKPSGGWEDMTETAKLTASDGANSDIFGKSVSISGDNIVIGAYGDDDNGDYSGSAYVFAKPSGGWEDITETAKLTASDGAEYDYFGCSVSISGDNIIVGAHKDDDNGDYSGSAYVFAKPSGGWEDMTETAKLTASDGADNDWFGESVSISNDNIVIGAYGDDDNGSKSGSVYVFSKPSSGWATNTENQKIIPNYIGNYLDNFGYSLAVDGDYAVVGSHGYNNGQGMTYVLYYDGYTWNKIAELKASDATDFDWFGYSVSISGDNIIIGAHGDDDNGDYSGSAYVFTKPSGGWEDMTETAKLTASDGVANDYFGHSVSISGDNIVIGAYGDNDNGDYSGSAYVFAKPSGGWEDMTETAKLTASDGADNDWFGYSVSVSDDNIIVGAYKDDDNGDASGSAYVFTKPSGGWSDMTETAKLTTSDGAANDYFGKSVSIDGDNIVIGAYWDNDNGSKSGSAYVFTKPSEGWSNMTETTKLTASDGAANDYFGKSVSIDGNNIVIGAYKDDDKSGSAYVFTKPSSGWVDITETAKLTASDGAANDYFGISVSINRDYIIIGACDDDITAGATYLFRNCTETNSEISPVVCDTYTSPSGKIWTTTGTYKDTILNANLCDSVITINLTVNYTEYQTVDTTICYNSSYTYADGTTVDNLVADESHISTLTALTECDSIITENVTILDAIDVSTSVAEDLTITANALDLTYQWLDCDNAYSIISGATEQSFAPTVNGNYAVKITDGSCSDTSNCVTITTMGIIEPSITNQVNIYPNPTKGIVNINLGALKNVSISVSDISGKVIYTAKNINSKTYQFKLNQKSGVYFVKIRSDDKTQTFKLIKQ